MATRLKLLVAAVALVILVAAAGIWWFFRGDAPAAVSLTAAVAEASEDTSLTVEASDGSSTGIEGSWTVDTESGEFDYDSATGTFAGFRIEEELASIGSTTAVGRTGDVSGSILIGGTTVTAASFEVDLTGITTNESRRDDEVQEALATEAFPTATFSLTEPIELGETASSGEPLSVVAVGDLTIHGVTRPVEVALDAQLVGNTVVAVGSVEITFSDYDVEVPDSQIVLSVEDQGVLEFQLLLTQG